MDDEGGDWFSEAAEEAPAVEVQKEAAAPAAAEESGAAPPAADEEQRPTAEPEEYLDPDKLLLFKHWIRPKFLQYNYLYNYRHNYYDDVIDYLDKKQKGLSRDVPRAQTWAERALRTYNSQSKRDEYYEKVAADTKLVTNTKLSGAFFHYHTKEYVNRRYSSILH